MRDTVSTEMQALHAYVDGQLSPEERTRVEERLKVDPVAWRQVKQYEEISQDLHSRFDSILSEQIPSRLRYTPRPWQRPLAAIAASLFFMLIGLWIGQHLQTGAPTMLVAGSPHVVRDAAIAYAVYAPEVRHPVEVPGDQEQHLVAWLTKRLGGEVQAPNLNELGYQLVGGRLLTSEDGPGALFMYENSAGRRVTLYICREKHGGRTTAFRFAEHEQVSLFYWYDGPFFYALAGELDHSNLLRLAESVYHQITI